MASLLATFSIHKALDERGEEIPVVPQFSAGVTVFVECLLSIYQSADILLFSHPETFPCRIVPRFRDASAERLTQLVGEQ